MGDRGEQAGERPNGGHSGRCSQNPDSLQNSISSLDDTNMKPCSFTNPIIDVGKKKETY